MAAEAKREPGPLKRWLLKLRESWRRSGEIKRRSAAAQRAQNAKTSKHGWGNPGL